jgi:ornithine cyclodeaminase
VRFLDADAVAALGPAAAVHAVTQALLAGLDPSADPLRVSVDLSHGQFLLMPSEARAATGVKVVTVAPDNPARGLPRIQAVYLLFDRQTLTLRAALDGTALTTLRTPAVSVAAVVNRLPPRALRVAIIGAGPQATGHAVTLAAVRPVDVCATSAWSPVFDSRLLRDDAVVVAVGSHEPDATELDASLLRRATVVVEDVEAGDVVMAIAQGALTPRDLVPVRDVVRGSVDVPSGRPLVFKSVGMAWQDLVIAEAVLENSSD